MIPYTFHDVQPEDVEAVVRVMRRAAEPGDHTSRLTQGPEVEAFERELAVHAGGHVVACNSGTAALHLALASLGVGPGDEVVVPALTFVATAAAVHYCGARVVLADVDPSTGLMTPRHLADRLTARTRAVVGVDYAGRPCDYAGLRATIRDHLPGRQVALVADAAHALGATSLDRFADLDAACYSFHPAKHVACGEGGAVAFRLVAYAVGAQALRNHARLPSGWCASLGHNYRLPELSAALGRSQLRRLHARIEDHAQLALVYDQEIGGAFDAGWCEVEPLSALDPGGGPVEPDVHAWHLFVVRVREGTEARARLRAELAEEGYGTQVHYEPLTHHPVVGRDHPWCPGAEKAGATYLSLPLHPGVTDADAHEVARIVVEGGW